MYIGKNGVILKIDEKTGKESLVAKFRSELKCNVDNIAKQMNNIRNIPRDEKKFQETLKKLPQISNEKWTIK